jgi:outer membrane protein TolC
LAGAKGHAYDTREQGAIKTQRGWEQDAALGKILPAFTARGSYTRNQYAAQIPAGAIGNPVPITIQKQDQLAALFQLDVPIVDLANYHRYKQAKHLAEAQDLQVALTGNDVDRAVSKAYYNFLGASALVESAGRTLKISDENYQFVNTRRQAGVATDLDLERAKANVEQSKQNVADAELSRSLAARQLETLSGVTPESATQFPQDDLVPESSLNQWISIKETPTDRLNAKVQEAAVSGRRAAAYALAPTLSGVAQENVSNIAGFAGHPSFYVLQGVLSWRLDYNVYSTAQAQAAANNVTVIRNERARRALEDTIFEAYRRVEAGIAKSKSARAQAVSADKAAALAAERYQAGASTQLDVTQAQRDSFTAAANRIQADADLAFSRVSLRVAAGKSPLLGQKSGSSLPAENQPIAPPTTQSIGTDPNVGTPTKPTTPTPAPTPAPTR